MTHRLSQVLRALSDPTRQEIVQLLSADEWTVTDLIPILDISQPSITQHIGVLREAGLVRERRAGRYKFLSLERRPLRPAAKWLDELVREEPTSTRGGSR
jgi:DNA-binding transcriptional ArsR family regulator